MYEWMDKAACAGLGSDLFFVDDESDGYDREDLLRDVCTSCPVLATCAGHAIEHEEFGFWGNMTERERRSIKRKRRKR
jgi:WhiB family redox-sensing transcriptional regulator